MLQREANVAPLDRIDQQIIRQLRDDSSISSERLAKLLFVSARTVRSRIERLRDAGIIELTVRVNRERAGYPATADIVAQVEANRVHEIADRIAEFPEVGYVAITTGSQDISIQVYARSTDDIHRFVVERLAPLPGIIRTNTFVLFKIIKDRGWLPPEDADPPDPTRRGRPRREG
jgi:Lrp/AsnC family transcriptional regulator for asnA, asnC and gidA